MAGKHFAQPDSKPNSGAFNKNDHADNNHAAKKNEAAPKRKRHRGRIAAVVIVALVVVAGGVAYAVPSSRAALLGLLGQAQSSESAQQQTAASNDSTTDEQSADSQDETSDSSSNTSSDQGTDEAESTDASQQAEEEAEPEPVEDTSPLDASASAAVTTTTTASGMTMTVPVGFETTTTYQNLESALSTFLGKGYKLGFVMVDLSTGRGVSYNADQMMYPASSIKAAYCTMVLETTGGQVSSSVSSTIEDCIVNSSNDAFHSLINSYGLNSYGNWLSKYAPNAAPKAYMYYYPDISANELANVWREIYRYGKSGEAGSDILTSALSQSNHSALGGLLRSRYTVWSKPGWYPADGNGIQATNDTGIVFSDCGDYLLVLESNADEDFSQIFPLIDALNATHGKICGGSSALLMTSKTTVSGSEA